MILLRCRIVDLRHKEVINVSDGSRIGCVNDVEVDIKCAKIISIVIYGRLKFFGVFGREDDIVIKWENIDVVGEDTILVKYSPISRRRRKFNIFNKFFN